MGHSRQKKCRQGNTVEYSTKVNPNEEQFERRMVVLGHREIVVSAASKGGDAPVDLGVVEMEAPRGAGPLTDNIPYWRGESVKCEFAVVSI